VRASEQQNNNKHKQKKEKKRGEEEVIARLQLVVSHIAYRLYIDASTQYDYDYDDYDDHDYDGYDNKQQQWTKGTLFV